MLALLMLALQRFLRSRLLVLVLAQALPVLLVVLGQVGERGDRARRREIAAEAWWRQREGGRAGGSTQRHLAHDLC